MSNPDNGNICPRSFKNPSTRDVKDNKKGFFKYISRKRKTRESVGPLLNEVGALVTKDTEEVVLLDAFFA